MQKFDRLDITKNLINLQIKDLNNRNVLINFQTEKIVILQTLIYKKI